MAFPSLGTPTASQQTGNSTTSNVTLPASVAAGDLIIALIGADLGAGAMTWPSPWVKLAERVDTAHVMSVGYLIATGGETTVGVTHTTERSNHLAWKVTGWHGTTPPEVSALANGSSISPDPGSVAPSWGAGDTLWMALATWDDSATPTVSAYPTNYSDGQGTNVTATSAGRVAGAGRQLNAASEDPGAFTLSGTETWAAFTVAVRPAGAAGPITGTATWDQAAGSWAGSAAEKLPSTATFDQAAAGWAAVATEKLPSTATFAQAAATWAATATEKLPSTATFAQAAGIWSASASTPSNDASFTASFAQAAGAWSATATEKLPSTAAFVQAAAAWAGVAAEALPSTASFAQAAAAWAATATHSLTLTSTASFAQVAGAWDASASITGVVASVDGDATASVLLLHTATASVGGATADATVTLNHSATATVS